MSAQVMNVTIHAKEDHLVSLGFGTTCVRDFMESFVNPHMDAVTSGTLDIGYTLAKGVTLTLNEHGKSVALGSPLDLQGMVREGFSDTWIPFRNLLRALNSTGVVRSGSLLPDTSGAVGLIDWLCRARYRSGSVELSLQPLCDAVSGAGASHVVAALSTDHFQARTATEGFSGEDLHAVLGYRGKRCRGTCAKLGALKELRQAGVLAAAMYSKGCYCGGMVAASKGPRTPAHMYDYIGHNFTIAVPSQGADDDVTSENVSDDVAPDDVVKGKRKGSSFVYRFLQRGLGATLKQAKEVKDSDESASSIGDSAAYTVSHIFYGTAWLWLPQGFLVLTGLSVSMSRGYAAVADRDAYTFNAKAVMTVLAALLFMVRIVEGHGGYLGLDWVFSTNKTVIVLEYVSVTLALFMNVAGLFAPDRIPFGQSSAIQYLCGTFGVYVFAVAMGETSPDALLLVFTLLTLTSGYGLYMLARNSTATSDSYPMLIILWNFIACTATEFWALSSTLSKAYSPQIGALVYIVNDYLPYSLYCNSPFFIVRAALHLDDATVWVEALTDRPWVLMVGAPLLVLVLRIVTTLLPRCAIAFRAVRAPTFDSVFMLFCYSFWAYLVDMSCIWRHLVHVVYGFHTRSSSGMLLVHLFFTYIDFTCIRELFYVRATLSVLWWLAGASLIRLSSAATFAASVRLITKEFRIPGALPHVAVHDINRMCQSNYRIEVLDVKGSSLASGTCVIAVVDGVACVTTISHFSDCVGVPDAIKIVGTPCGLERFVGLIMTIVRPSLLPAFPKADPVTRFQLLPRERDNMEMGFVAGLGQAFPDASPDDISVAKLVYIHTYEKESMTPLQDVSLSFKAQGTHTTIEEVAVDVCMARGDSGGGAFLVLPSGSIRYLGAISRAVLPSRGDTDGPSNLVSVVGSAILCVKSLHRLIGIPLTKALCVLPYEALREKRLAALSAVDEAERHSSKVSDELYQLTRDTSEDENKPKRDKVRKEKEKEKAKAKARAQLMQAHALQVRDEVVQAVKVGLEEYKTTFTEDEYNLPGDWRLRRLTQFRPYDVIMHYVADPDIRPGGDGVSPMLTELLNYVHAVLPKDSPDAVALAGETAA